MQAETVYEFGTSPDEDDDDTGTNQPRTTTNTALPVTNLTADAIQQPTNAASSVNLGGNSTSAQNNNNLATRLMSESRNFAMKPKQDRQNVSDKQHKQQRTPDKRNLNASILGSSTNQNADSREYIKADKSQSTLLLSHQKHHNTSLNFGVEALSSTSNTSLTSSATNSSSRGNINQSSRSSNQLSTSQQNPSFDSNVISERVKNLATQIYQELKRIISICNYNEDILSGLMPLIVRVLESLDLALIENQQLQVDLELCKDDNEQLVAMFEKEKQAKRALDKKLIETEYAFEEDRQKYQHKLETLDNSLKLLELKSKNASDQAARFEEKDIERKAEYSKLHDRYTELLKSHCDVVERVRHLVNNDSNEATNLTSINVPSNLVQCHSDLTLSEPPAYSLTKARGKSNDADLDSNSVMRRDFSSSTKSWNADTELTLEDTSLVILDDQVHTSYSSAQPESSETEAEHDKDGDKDSITYTSMEKEFRKLIQENKDLLNVKNALNIVKDDLITDVDRLTNEASMYEQALGQLNVVKDQMKKKISDLDHELRKTKDELEIAKQKIREDNEEGVPYAQRRRFGRSEMAKILMERNDYKERYLELQNALKFTQVARANKMEAEKRSGIWKFFSNLFGAPSRELLAIGGPGPTTTPRNSSPAVPYGSSSFDQSAIGTEPGNTSLSPDSMQQSVVVHSGPIQSTNHRLSNNSDFIFLMDSDLNIDRTRALKQETRGLDLPGYIHAYGWSVSSVSLRSTGQGTPTNDEGKLDLVGKASSALKVPIPQYCRPLVGQSLGMKIWCGTAIDMSGGDSILRKDSVHLPEDSQYDNSGPSTPARSSYEETSASSSERALRRLEEDVNIALRKKQNDRRASNMSGLNISSTPNKSMPVIKTTSSAIMKGLPVSEEFEELSTCVWICSTQHSRSKVTIIDIKNKPDELLYHFYVPTFLYCIKAIPGFKSGDLSGIHASVKCTDRETETSVQSSKTYEMIKQLIENQRNKYYTFVEIDKDEESKLLQRRLLQRQTSSLDSPGISANSSPLKINANESVDAPSNLNESQELAAQKDAEISRILDKDTSIGDVTLQKLNDFVAHTQPLDYSQLGPSSSQVDCSSTDIQELNQNENNEQGLVYQPMSTFLPTVWMGGKNCCLYIHSAIGQWKDYIASVKLADSILQICHFRGRIFVALADGSICMFMRNLITKEWELSSYVSIDIALICEKTSDYLTGADVEEIHSKIFKNSGHDTVAENKQEVEGSTSEIIDDEKIESTANSHKLPSNRREKVSGIKCMEIANKNLWIGYRNRVLILDTITLKPKHIFNVVPQTDNQIREITSMRDGVFICLRSDLILRLYSSLKPYNHIQNIDIEPVITRFISPKTFVISHITTMKAVDNTLWIGNAHGIILRLPFTMVSIVSEATSSNSNDGINQGLSISCDIPQCDVTKAQISFHGHQDSVKFFVNCHQLMLSGGQGYIDFRLDADDQSKVMSDKSHLIVWHLIS